MDIYQQWHLARQTVDKRPRRTWSRSEKGVVVLQTVMWLVSGQRMASASIAVLPRSLVRRPVCTHHGDHRAGSETPVQSLPACVFLGEGSKP